MATHLFIHFTFKNLQRAGAAINMTLDEANNFREQRSDGKLFLQVMVEKHKTATTYGPAVVYLSGNAISCFHYFLNLRNKADEDGNNNFLIRSNNSLYVKHYNRYVTEYAKSVGITFDKIPSITQFRKIGSTMAMEDLTQAEMEHVSTQMGHSSATAEKYYCTATAGSKSLGAFKSLTSVIKSNESIALDFSQAFASSIEERKTPSLYDCRKYLEATDSSLTAKQIQDRVRQRIRKLDNP